MIQLLNRRMFLGAASGEEAQESNYLTFEALADGTFSFTRNALSYSMDGGVTWSNLSVNTQTPTVSAGSKIMWKATSPTVSTDYGIGTFSATADFNVMGNAMSLVSGDNYEGATSVSSYQFRLLFGNNTHIVNAEKLALPATTLASSCYRSMFSNCTALLTSPPILPATTLASDCYREMFRGCSNLIAAPGLPATTLTTRCYYQLFYSCSKLNYIKCMATSIGANNSHYYWVSGVASSGTFVRARNTNWGSGASGIPSNWTVISE